MSARSSRRSRPLADQRSCIHCGAPYDERSFASHGPSCPHTLSGRYAAQSIVERLQGCTPGVMADIIAQEMRRVRKKAFIDAADFVDTEAPKWQACSPAVSAIATMLRIRAGEKK